MNMTHLKKKKEEGKITKRNLKELTEKCTLNFLTFEWFLFVPGLVRLTNKRATQSISIWVKGLVTGAFIKVFKVGRNACSKVS